MHLKLKVKRLSVGIPKELKVGERRVALTPKGVASLVRNGIAVFVEQQAGLAAGFQDRAYRRAGATVLPNRKMVWAQADIIKKVKEPLGPEFQHFRKNQIIFTFLHLAAPSQKKLVQALVKRRVTAIGYETVEVGGKTPILASMSRIAGIVAGYVVGVLRRTVRKKGRHLMGIQDMKRHMIRIARHFPQVPKHLKLGKVVVLGGGQVGGHAAWTMAQMGGDVIVSEWSEKQRTKLARDFEHLKIPYGVIDSESTLLTSALERADVIVGAVHQTGARAPLVVNRTLLKKVSRVKSKVIIDISIDQGGNIAESVPHTYDEPLYLDSFGNIRFSVTNVPAICPRAGSIELEKVSLGYLKALTLGERKAFHRYPELKRGVNTRDGKCLLNFSR
jgi:alanine dehydrogenase